jgi:hypothetical protein
MAKSTNQAPKPSQTADPVVDWAEIRSNQDLWTVKGEPVHSNLRHLIVYEHTDQWRNDPVTLAKMENGPVVQFGATEWDKALEAWEANPDPAAMNVRDVLVQRYLPKAKAAAGKELTPRWVSEQHLSHYKDDAIGGMTHDHWLILKGKNGEPIRDEGSLLAVQPTEMLLRKKQREEQVDIDRRSSMAKKFKDEHRAEQEKYGGAVVEAEAVTSIMATAPPMAEQYA